MLAEDRRNYILRLLESRSSVSVAELSATFSLSEVSVRKLLSTMEEEGLIRRTWGGAVSAYGSLREFSHKEKEPVQLLEKIAIAKAAYGCIAEGDAVFLDCGTTTIQLARLIRTGAKRHLMVATTGVNIALELAEAEDIPVFAAGGVWDGKDAARMARQGAAGVQMATRFIGTYECDASQGFKDILLAAKKEDIQIVQSPVGMPGRALRTPLIERLSGGVKTAAEHCVNCLTPCPKKETPYCIMEALVKALKGNYEEGLFFCGSNVWRMDKMMHVSELIDEIMRDWRAFA